MNILMSDEIIPWQVQLGFQIYGKVVNKRLLQK